MLAVSGIGDGETQSSMKAPPKRKGNRLARRVVSWVANPQ